MDGWGQVVRMNETGTENEGERAVQKNDKERKKEKEKYKERRKMMMMRVMIKMWRDLKLRSTRAVVHPLLTCPNYL